MEETKVREITDFLAKEQLFAKFTERSGNKNPERYGIYDIRNSSYGSFMIRFNEAYNSGKLVHYIDLRIPRIGFSEILYDYNFPIKKNNTENSDYRLLYDLIQRIRIRPSGISYDVALDNFRAVMTRPEISTNSTEKFTHACVMYDVINEMISMGPRNTKYVAIPYGYRVSVKFPGGMEGMSFQSLPSTSEDHKTLKIEMLNVKVTEKFNNYEDHMNIMMFEQAERYMQAVPKGKSLAPGKEPFNRNTPQYLNFRAEVVRARQSSITK